MSLVKVFGTEVCPNCTNVVNYLKQNGLQYQYSTIGVDVEKEQVDRLAGRAIRTVPVIFVDGAEVTFEALREQYSTLSMLGGLEL